MSKFLLIVIVIIGVSSASIKTLSSCTIIIITQPAFAIFHHLVIRTAAAIVSVPKLLFTTGIIIPSAQMKDMLFPFALITTNN